MKLIKIFNLILALFLNRKVVKINLEQPLVSFTFDDIPSSAVRGAKLLEQYHKKGTFYIAGGLIANNTNQRFNCKEEDILELLAGKHELGCHTYHHFDASKVTNTMYDDSIQKNQQFMKETFGIEMKSFAYPHGSASPSIKQICNKYYESGRSVISGINLNEADKYLLKANRLYSNSISIKKYKNLIDTNNKQKGWLIFFTHDIGDNPSEYGCTLDYLQEIIEYANKSALILPVNEAMEYIKNTNSP